MRRHIPKESRIESVAVEIMRQLLRMAWNGFVVVIAEHRILYPWEAGIIIIAIFVGKNYKRGSCMSKIAIVTDSNSGISQTQAKEMGISIKVETNGSGGAKNVLSRRTADRSNKRKSGGVS